MIEPVSRSRRHGSAHNHHLFETFNTLSGNGRVKEDRSNNMQKPIHQLFLSKWHCVVKVENPIDRSMQTPEASLPNDLLALHGTFSTGYSS